MEIRKLALALSIPLCIAISGKKNKGTKNPIMLKNPLAPTKRNAGFIKSSNSVMSLNNIHIDCLSLLSRSGLENKNK